MVQRIIKDCRHLIDRMYVEVPDNLADFDDYVPFGFKESLNPLNKTQGALPGLLSRMGRGGSVHGAWSWANYRPTSKQLCDSKKRMIRPSIAQDINGRWLVIVQSALYHQQVPIEICTNPGTNCNHIDQCHPEARCVQRFQTQLLMSIDLRQENECPMMRLYRFPSACVCESTSTSSPYGLNRIR